MNKEMGVSTAIKAIWLLYRRGKWPLLESIGVSQSLYEGLFREFDTRYITSDHGLLRQEAQVHAFLQFVGPDVVDKAVFLLHMYWLISSIERSIDSVKSA